MKHLLRHPVAKPIVYAHDAMPCSSKLLARLRAKQANTSCGVGAGMLGQLMWAGPRGSPACPVTLNVQAVGTLSGVDSSSSSGDARNKT